MRNKTRRQRKKIMIMKILMLFDRFILYHSAENKLNTRNFRLPFFLSGKIIKKLIAPLTSNYGALLSESVRSKLFSHFVAKLFQPCLTSREHTLFPLPFFYAEALADARATTLQFETLIIQLLKF